jgi:transposase
MRDPPRTCRTPSLCRLPSSCVGHLGAGERTPIGLGGGDTRGHLAYALQLAQGLAHARPGGVAERPSRWRTCQAHDSIIRHSRTNRTRITVYTGPDRPTVTRNPPRCPTVQPRLSVGQHEKAGLIFYPDTAFAEKKRCPERFEAARENLRRCQTAAREGKLSLFYLDESGFATIPNVQRAWAPKGKPHAADASAARQRVNVVGALDYAAGKLWYNLHGQSVKRTAVVELIDRIARREQRMPLTLVVLDNAKIHHNIDPKKLDEWWVEHRLVLMHLPPYSPELNPIEIVWKQAKYHWRRFVTWSKDELLEEVQKLMNGIGSDYKIGFS